MTKLEILGIFALGLSIAGATVLMVLNWITPDQMAIFNAIGAGGALMYVVAQFI